MIRRLSTQRFPRPFRILGIETSCDDTAAAVVDSERKILGEASHNQMKFHQPWGGIVPSIAKNHHYLNLVPVVANAMKDIEWDVSRRLNRIESFRAGNTVLCFRCSTDNRRCCHECETRSGHLPLARDQFHPAATSQVSASILHSHSSHGSSRSHSSTNARVRDVCPFVSSARFRSCVVVSNSRIWSCWPAVAIAS